MKLSGGLKVLGIPQNYFPHSKDFDQDVDRMLFLNFASNSDSPDLQLPVFFFELFRARMAILSLA